MSERNRIALLIDCDNVSHASIEGVIDELSKEQVDVLIIVSDWLMPGKKGDEFLIEVHKKYPEIVKVMLTGQANESAIENAVKNAKLYAFLNKPWTAKELETVIRDGLSGTEKYLR